jgi:hypothetical protein
MCTRLRGGGGGGFGGADARPAYWMVIEPWSVRLPGLS